VSLTNVWVQTQSDGLVRADQITGIDAHQTPAVTGKPSRWLLDVVLADSSIGSGTREGWTLTTTHRTLIQTSHDPGQAPTTLARLLAQLDHISAAGLITTSRTSPPPPPDDHPRDHAHDHTDELTARSGPIRFRFTPFPQPAPGHHTGAEYL
jgi:hypothetical protein